MKNRLLKIVVCVAIPGLLAACGGKENGMPQEIHEKIIWSSSSERPETDHTKTGNESK